jgi:predicted RecB family nuclease
LGLEEPLTFLEEFGGLMNPAHITGSLLYDLVSCPRRVALDLFGDPSKRDPISPFVRLLWERGNLFERKTIAGLKIPYLDLSQSHESEKEHITLAAMKRGEPLIYSGRISAGDLVGIPDLLRKSPGGYIPGDIKSGRGEEGGGQEGGDEEGKPKLEYAVQLGLYVDVLEQLGLSAGRRAFVWDIHGEEVPYDFSSPRGSKTPDTLWDFYQEALAEARSIISRAVDPKPANAAICKLCHWRSECWKEIQATDDLTMIPQLGRAKRDVMESRIPTVADLAECNPEGFIKGEKTDFRGIGPDTLKTFHSRARVLKSAEPKPFLKGPIALPVRDRELFFDIECDPMRDFCYLHGFVERRDNSNATEKFVAFFCDELTAEAEERAFADSISFIRAAQPATLFYYSKYERTVYRKLQDRYPAVCSAGDIERLFDPKNAVDLYFDVVLPATEWPTYDFSLKTLAKYLGFVWRDTDPSGAASIEWFNRWIETGDSTVKQRILDYNEDDCRATRVLLDGIRDMSLC